MTTLNRLPMTKEVRRVLEESTGMLVGRAAIPRVGTGADATFGKPPYFIVYPGWATTSGPPFAAPDADTAWYYQISAYSSDGDQLEWMRDKILSTYLARDAGGGFVTPMAVPGQAIMDRRLSEDAGGSPSPDGAAGIMSIDVRIAFDVTPA